MIAIPRKTRQKVEYKTGRRLKRDGFVKSAIRKVVHSVLYENTPLTLATVLAKVNKDPELPTFRKTTLWKLLKETVFCYERRNRRALLLERNYLILWRHFYLRQIKKFHREKRPIVYLDETLINVSQTINKV